MYQKSGGKDLCFFFIAPYPLDEPEEEPPCGFIFDAMVVSSNRTSFRSRLTYAFKASGIEPRFLRCFQARHVWGVRRRIFLADILEMSMENIFLIDWRKKKESCYTYSQMLHPFARDWRNPKSPQNGGLQCSGGKSVPFTHVVQHKG